MLIAKKMTQFERKKVGQVFWIDYHLWNHDMKNDLECTMTIHPFSLQVLPNLHASQFSEDSVQFLPKDHCNESGPVFDRGSHNQICGC